MPETPTWPRVFRWGSWARLALTTGGVLLALVVWTVLLGPAVQRYAAEREEWTQDRIFLRAARQQAIRQAQAEQAARTPTPAPAGPKEGKP